MPDNTGTTIIEVWYGDSNTNPIGPIEGRLISQNGSEAEIEITDSFWLDNMGWEGEPYYYTCNRLPYNRYVSYDDYAWSPVGEGGEENKWW